MSLLAYFRSGPDQPVTGSGAEIDAEYRRQRRRVILAVTLGYGIAYICRLALNVVKKPLIDAGLFSPSELGLIGSALFYGYGLGKLFNGFLADHANVRKYMAAGILCSALLNVAMGFSGTLLIAVALWGLNGWFQSMGGPGSVISLTNWFSSKERGRYYGIWSTSHSIGEGLTFAVLPILVALLGWRWGFWGAGLMCVLVAAGVYAVLPDRPQTLGLPAVADWATDRHGAQPPRRAPAEVLRAQLSILRIPAVWVLALASAAAYVARYAINGWGVLYLQEARGYSLAEAGTALTLSTFAGFAGAIAIGYMSDLWFAARRPPVNMLFGLLQITGLVLLFWGPANKATVIAALMMFAFGTTGVVTTVGGLFAVDICPKQATGAALGVIGLFSYVGSALQEQISGVLIERGMTLVDGVRHYDFAPAIHFWVGAAVVSLLLAASLWRQEAAD